eukprot:14944619-Alexandrium_andersonii.AAC.1
MSVQLPRAAVTTPPVAGGSERGTRRAEGGRVKNDAAAGNGRLGPGAAASERDRARIQLQGATGQEC